MVFISDFTNSFALLAFFGIGPYMAWRFLILAVFMLGPFYFWLLKFLALIILALIIWPLWLWPLLFGPFGVLPPTPFIGPDGCRFAVLTQRLVHPTTKVLFAKRGTRPTWHSLQFKQV